jgi:hypothetical protein
VIILLLAACAAPGGRSGGAQFQSGQAELVNATLQRVDAAPHQRPRIFFIGLAMYSEGWSENDVVDFSSELSRLPSFVTVPLIFSNSGGDQPGKFPTVDMSTVEQTAQHVAEHAGPDDVIIVYASTHGGTGLLAEKVGDSQPTAVTGGQLFQALAPLGDHKTIIMLSACFSGSLISDLAGPNRIIITAARADRSSFGCQADADHTLFGKAVLDAFAPPSQSLQAIFTNIKDDVARLEQQRQFAPPSEPQISVGGKVEALYEEPVF